MICIDIDYCYLDAWMFGSDEGTECATLMFSVWKYMGGKTYDMASANAADIFDLLVVHIGILSC